MIKFLTVFIFLLAAALLAAQPIGEKTIAKVGNISITENEFVERYELTPLYRKNIKKMKNSLKLEFLYSLAAEKLWALEAERLGFDTTEVMKFATTEFQKMFVRDILFHREIKDQVIVTEEDVINGYFKSTSALKVNFIFSENEEEIFEIFRLLNTGFPFDSILVERSEYQEQPAPIEVIFGQLLEEVEDSVFTLRVGNYTSPLFTPDGWYIFRVVNRSESLLITEQDRNDALNRVKKTIEARRLDQYFDEFYMEFFKDKKIEADAALFKILAQNIKDIFEKKRNEVTDSSSNLLSIISEDVIEIENRIGKETLDKIFIKFDSNPFSLKAYLRLIAFDGFNLKPEEIPDFFPILNSKTRSVIEKELLAREGIRRGYHLLPEVQNQIAMWRGNYLFQLLQNQFLDSASVSDDEVYQQYLLTNKEESFPQLVNIVEVLTDSLEVVDKVLRELNEGKDIYDLAVEHTQREWTKKNRGEFGLFPVTMHGEIGRIASTLEVGEIYGPLKVPDGYSIFKVIDSQEQNPEVPKPFEAVKEEIKRNLAFSKMRHKMSTYTVSLAKRYGLTINPDVLMAADVTDINTFAYRMLGFGGRITAVPLLAPNNDWVEQWINSSADLQ
jgi:parvulin-like peptidyl-prolyl isomerase